MSEFIEEEGDWSFNGWFSRLDLDDEDGLEPESLLYNSSRDKLLSF